MRRRVLLPLASVFLLLLALDTGIWFVASSRLRQHFADWQASANAAGWEVGSGPVGLAGWPFAAGVTVANLTLRRGTAEAPGGADIAARGDAALAAPAMTLTISAFDIGTLHFGFANPLHLRVAGLPDLILSGEAIGLTTPVRAADPQPVSLRAEALRIEPASGSSHAVVGSLVVDASFAMTGRSVSPEVTVVGTVPGTSAASTRAPASAPMSDMRVQAHTISLPNTARWAFGNEIAALSGRLTLDGAWPGPGAPDVAARAWRDKGGAMRISDFVLDWGKLTLGGSGTVRLDEALQPSGSAMLHISDYAQALDRMAASGVLSRSAATAATAILSLLGGGTDSAQPGSVDVPLTLQSRTLSMGALPLLRVPTLDWQPTR